MLDTKNATTILRVLIVWFWIMGSVGFLVQMVLPRGYEGLVFSVGLLADAAIMLLAALTIRHKADWLIAGTYIVFSAYSCLVVNNTGVVLWINGMRTYFSIVCVLPVVRWFWEHPQRHQVLLQALPRQAIAFLIAMAVTITLQFMRFGPGDQVGGIFGNFNSGVASITIYITSFWLMHRSIDREHFGVSMAKHWHYIFLLYPTFLNETKISFVLLALYFVLLLPIDRKLVKRIAIVVPSFLLFAFLAVTAYTSVNDNNSGTDLFGEGFLENYLMGDLERVQSDAEYGLKYEDELPDVPRIAKIALMPMVHDMNPGHHLAGFGLGLFKGGNTLGITGFQEEYDWLLVGTQPVIFSIYMQLGILGVIWHIILFGALYTVKPAHFRHRDLNIQLYATAIFVALLVYSDLWLQLNFGFPILLFWFLSWQPGEAQPDPEP